MGNRSLYLSLKDRPRIKKIRTLFICLDNTCSSNKCWTIMHGMGTLVALGIAEKVIITYRLVGHTKNEVDQAGGIISKTISSKTMMTPDVWKERVEHAIHGHLTKCYDMKSVEFCCGCPDYTSQFIDEYFDTTQIMGLARVQEVRFAMHPTEDHVEFHYKTHALSQGWLPRYRNYYAH